MMYYLDQKMCTFVASFFGRRSASHHLKISQLTEWCVLISLTGLSEDTCPLSKDIKV